MTTTTLHPLAADYLARLESAARRLPSGERRELVEEIRAHLREATDADMSDAEALTALERLGEPGEIVDAQRPDEDLAADPRGIHEWAAIFLPRPEHHARDRHVHDPRGARDRPDLHLRVPRAARR
jgi:hypothetical protein